MCMFSADITFVNSTQIGISCNPELTRQVLIYNNVVKLESKNNSESMFDEKEEKKVPAMLFALPGDDIEQVQFVTEQKIIETLRTLPQETKNLCQVFHSYVPVRSKGFDSLKQLDVGSYRVTLTNSVEDLEKVPEMILMKEAKEFLEKTYPKGKYIFVCCCLRPDLNEQSYEPLACSFPMYEKKLFVPTMHFHPGAKHDIDWDHLITFFLPDGVFFPHGYVHRMGSSLEKIQSPIPEIDQNAVLSQMYLQSPDSINEKKDNSLTTVSNLSLVEKVYQFGYNHPIVEKLRGKSVWKKFHSAYSSIVQHLTNKDTSEDLFSSYTVTMLRLFSRSKSAPNGDLWITKVCKEDGQ